MTMGDIVFEYTFDTGAARLTHGYPRLGSSFFWGNHTVRSLCATSQRLTQARARSRTRAFNICVHMVF